jgi:hypothetical protein
MVGDLSRKEKHVPASENGDRNYRDGGQQKYEFEG